MTDEVTNDPGSMFDVPQQMRDDLASMVDRMIGDMEERANDFLKQIDEQRDTLNMVADQLTPAELERRDLVNGLGQMSADYALVPLKFVKTNREALLRNGPDLIYLIVDIVMGCQEAVKTAVEQYEKGVDDASRAMDKPE